ncbi:MAG: hypothetical protein CMI61_01115 [Parvibaculum sp.]|nr:hypothetical protein [Parvibaculum sp.]
MTTETPGFAQAVFFEIAEIPPARIDVIAVSLDDVAIYLAPQVVVVNIDFGAQGIFDSPAQFAGYALHAVFPAHVFEADEDESDLARIPRAMKASGVHGDTAVIVEIQWQDDGFVGYGVQKTGAAVARPSVLEPRFRNPVHVVTGFAGFPVEALRLAVVVVQVVDETSEIQRHGVTELFVAEMVAAMPAGHRAETVPRARAFRVVVMIDADDIAVVLF